MEINIVEKQKNKRIKNVEVLSMSLHNEFVHMATQDALEEIGFLNRFRPGFKNTLSVRIASKLNKLYVYRLGKNINQSKKKITTQVKKNKKGRK